QQVFLDINEIKHLHLHGKESSIAEKYTSAAAVCTMSTAPQERQPAPTQSDRSSPSSSSSSSDESSFRDDPEIAAVLERQRLRYAKEYAHRGTEFTQITPEFELRQQLLGQEIPQGAGGATGTALPAGGGEAGAAVPLSAASAGAAPTRGYTMSSGSAAMAQGGSYLQTGLGSGGGGASGRTAGAAYTAYDTSALPRTNPAPVYVTEGPVQLPTQTASGCSSGFVPATSSRDDWPQRDRDTTMATLRRQLQDEREQYLRGLKQWEEERTTFLEEIRTKDRIIHQLEQELIERPSHRDIATMRAELQRARDPSGQVKQTWKKADPRTMMDADRKLHSLNRRRKMKNLPELEHLDPIELRRFCTAVLMQLKLADLQEGEKAIEMMCKMVERSLPNLRAFAEEIYRI
ncbi:unnamed protein product, partial [Amoebophrya sp. A120]